MSNRAFVILMAVLVGMSGTLNAGVVPGRWEKVAAENLGSKFIITMQSSERIDGFFKGLQEDTLSITLLDGNERLVRKADVAKIITGDRRAGSLTNGFLIGLAAGAAIPIILAAGWDQGGVAALGLITGLLGGAIGIGVDAAVQGHITLYQTPKDKDTPKP